MTHQFKLPWRSGRPALDIYQPPLGMEHGAHHEAQQEQYSPVEFIAGTFTVFPMPTSHRSSRMQK